MKNMKYSSYLSSGIVTKRTNVVIAGIIKHLTSRLDFDNESLKNLNDYADRGRIAFASFQSSNVSLLMLLNLLKKHNIEMPVLALDFRPYMPQLLSDLFGRIAGFFRKIFMKTEYEPVSNENYIQDLMTGGSSIVLSLLSMNQFLKRYIQVRQDTIQYLVDAQKKIDVPIYIFPEIIFWNTNPERTRSIFRSKAIGEKGFFATIYSIITLNIFSSTGFVRMCDPINIMEEIEQAQTDDSKHIANRIRTRLFEKYNHEKRVTLGPVIKTQQEMMEKVLYHQNVMDAIDEVRAADKTSEKKLRRKAYKYFREIAADYSSLYIKYFDRAVNVMFEKVFDGLQYDAEEFSRKLKDASQKGPIIFTPSHRSHMDYLILSDICYKEKIIPPHIVAGSNLTFFPMGKIFRKSGAFFMRRSFKGLVLYTAIFKQYIKTLINEGYNIEFFIEGGRTRTGKLNFPKMGILKYLIESVEEGYNRDMVFVPLTINYDRIMEESSYHDELRGKKKNSESTSGFMKSRRFLKRKYGKVYLSMGDPVPYSELAEKFSQSSDMTVEIGYYLSRRINETSMVTPSAIVTTAIMLSRSKGFSRDMIRKNIETIYQYLIFMKAHFSGSTDVESIDRMIDFVLESYQEDAIVRPINFGEMTGENDNMIEGMYVLTEEDRARINMYKNSIIHLLLPVSFVSISILRLAGGDVTVDRITEGYREIMDLFTKEFIYTEEMEDADATVAHVLSHLSGQSIIALEGNNVKIPDHNIEDIKLFSRVVQDYIESYLIVIKTVLGIDRKINRRDLVSEIRKNGIRLYHLGTVRLVESLSMINYQNALSKLVSGGILNQEQTGKKNFELTVADKKRIECLNDAMENYLLRITRD